LTSRLIWRRTALLSRRLEVDRLEIGRLEVLRRPLPSRVGGQRAVDGADRHPRGRGREHPRQQPAEHRLLGLLYISLGQAF
jgi:hypothetical protein